MQARHSGLSTGIFSLLTINTAAELPGMTTFSNHSFGSSACQEYQKRILQHLSTASYKEPAHDLRAGICSGLRIFDLMLQFKF